MDVQVPTTPPSRNSRDLLWWPPYAIVLGWAVGAVLVFHSLAVLIAVVAPPICSVLGRGCTPDPWAMTASFAIFRGAPGLAVGWAVLALIAVFGRGTRRLRLGLAIGAPPAALVAGYLAT